VVRVHSLLYTILTTTGIALYANPTPKKLPPIILSGMTPANILKPDAHTITPGKILKRYVSWHDGALLATNMYSPLKTLWNNYGKTEDDSVKLKAAAKRDMIAASLRIACPVAGRTAFAYGYNNVGWGLTITELMINELPILCHHMQEAYSAQNGAEMIGQSIFKRTLRTACAIAAKSDHSLYGVLPIIIDLWIPEPILQEKPNISEPSISEPNTSEQNVDSEHHLVYFSSAQEQTAKQQFPPAVTQAFKAMITSSDTNSTQEPAKNDTPPLEDGEEEVKKERFVLYNTDSQAVLGTLSYNSSKNLIYQYNTVVKSQSYDDHILCWNNAHILNKLIPKLAHKKQAVDESSKYVTEKQVICVSKNNVHPNVMMSLFMLGYAPLQVYPPDKDHTAWTKTNTRKKDSV